MSGIESTINNQYARFFEQEDWKELKIIAQLYLKTAARLRTRHLLPTLPKRKLFRNIQKRLFLGIACELLLKSYYLKQGFCINKPTNKKRLENQLKHNFPYRLEEVNRGDFKTADTFPLNDLIQGFEGKNPIYRFNNHDDFLRGFKIAKVFRNKEAHAAAFWHKFDPQNYLDIATSLRMLYKEGFGERLDLQISVAKGDKAVYNVKKI